MNVKVLIGAVAGLGVAACVAACATSGRCRTDRDSENTHKATVWDKMREHMEEMPEDFPPRIMFDNVEATRANTDEILTLLRAGADTTTSARVDEGDVSAVGSAGR